MRITETITYDATPDEVYEMKTDPAFQERKCVEAGAVRHDVEVTSVGQGARVVTRRDLPTDDLPDFVKSIVGAHLTVTETYEWLGAAADGSRDGRVTVEAAGAPVALRGTVAIRPVATGTSLTIDGDLRASIPLLGGKIEKAAAPAFIRAIQREEESGRLWLAERA